MYKRQELDGLSPDRVLYLGQYGGYELDDPAADPCGSATYRLTILTEGGHDWLLEMPEAYSACRLWVNGEAYYSSGGRLRCRTDRRQDHQEMCIRDSP